MGTKVQFVDNGDKTYNIQVVKNAGVLVDARENNPDPEVFKDGFFTEVSGYTYIPPRDTQEFKDLIEAVQRFKENLKKEADHEGLEVFDQLSPISNLRKNVLFLAKEYGANRTTPIDWGHILSFRTDITDLVLATLDLEHLIY